MFRREPSLPKKLIVGILATALALVATNESFLRPHALIILLTAVVITSIYSGFFIALATILIAVLGHDFFNQFPKYSFSISSIENGLELLVFSAFALLLALLVSSLRQSYHATQAANAELEIFAAVAAHDLKAPVRSVAIFAQKIEKSLVGKLDIQEQENLRFIIDSAKRMAKLIDTLLVYSRFSKEKTRPFESVNIKTVLDQALANLSAAIDQARAKIIVENKLPALEGSPIQLLQLFQNLISNALKFRGDKIPEIHLKATNSPRAWIFEIKDNGIGIDPKFQDSIFEAFRRLHRNDEYEGSGLGLSICKRIVEHHGGKIWIKSEPENGTTFYFTLSKEIVNRRLTIRSLFRI